MKKVVAEIADRLWSSRSRAFCFFLITVVFVISRKLCAYSGVYFDNGYWMWQSVDFDLLKTSLARTIFHLHSQPPLLNLSLGLALKATTNQFDANVLLQTWFRLMGLLLMFATFQLMLDLCVPMALALVLTIVFEVNPGTMMLETWYYATYPTELLLCASAFFLNRFLIASSKWYGMSFLACATLPIFLNSSFQPVWYICVCAFSCFCFPARTRQLSSTYVTALVVVALLVARNAIVFGVFTTSSWFGMNLARLTTMQIPRAERQKEIRAHELSEFAAIETFSDLDAYPIGNAAPTGIPVLDRRRKADHRSNYNNILFVDISRHYLDDAVYTLVHHPAVYLCAIMRATGCYLGALKDQAQFVGRSSHLGVWNRAYDFLLVPARLSWWPRHQYCPTMSLTLMVGLPTIIILTLLGIVRRSEAWGAAEITKAFILTTIAYTSATGIMFEVGENARFRAVIDPLLIVLLGTLIADFARHTGLRPGRMRGETHVARSPAKPYTNNV